MLAALVAASKRCKNGVQKIHSKITKWTSHLVILLLNFHLSLSERKLGAWWTFSE